MAVFFVSQEGLNGFYKSLVPLWMRQIPYTMMKFACFEKTVELLYKYIDVTLLSELRWILTRFHNV